MLFGPRAKDANTSDGNTYSVPPSSQYGINLAEWRNFPLPHHAETLVDPQLSSNRQIVRTNSQDKLGQNIILEPTATTIYRDDRYQLNRLNNQNFDLLLLRYRQPYSSSFQLTILHYSSLASADLQQYIVNQPTNQIQSLPLHVTSDHSVPKFMNSLTFGESSSASVSNQPFVNTLRPLSVLSTLSPAQGYPISLLDSISSTNQSKFVQDPQRAYLNLLPIINRTTSHNLCDLLVATLRECLHQVPLDDFFNLLFDTQTAEVKLVPTNGTLVDKSQRPFKKEGLMLCSYIIETFRLPPYAREHLL